MLGNAIGPERVPHEPHDRVGHEREDLAGQVTPRRASGGDRDESPAGADERAQPWERVVGVEVVERSHEDDEVDRLGGQLRGDPRAAARGESRHPWVRLDTGRVREHATEPGEQQPGSAAHVEDTAPPAPPERAGMGDDEPRVGRVV